MYLTTETNESHLSVSTCRVSLSLYNHRLLHLGNQVESLTVDLVGPGDQGGWGWCVVLRLLPALRACGCVLPYKRRQESLSTC